MRLCSVLWFVLLTATLTEANNVALFWNLYEAVVSGGRILHDVAHGVGAVSKAIQAIDAFLDTTTHSQVTEALTRRDPASEEQDLTEERRPNPASSETSLSSFSGCGVLGIQIHDDTLPISSLTNCCSSHDNCYSSCCRVNKKDCDGKLRSCLYNACEGRRLQWTNLKSCRGAAKLLFSGTMALSSQQYNMAQEKLGCKMTEKGGRK